MRNFRTTHLSAVALLLSGLLLNVGCSEESGPIRIGMVAGLSGGNADLGQAGRNGAMLAVEEVNRAGGIRGRNIELVIRDDANSKEAAVTAAKDLVREKVDLIVGPFTSTMTEAVQTVTEAEEMLVFSPTASSTVFSGKDDFLLRLCSTSADNAEDYAEFMVNRRGYRRASLAVDQTNATFARTFVDAYNAEFHSLGGEIVVEAWDDFRSLVGFDGLVNVLLEPEPDVVFLIANAVDVARIIQQFRKVDAKTKIVAVEWAGTQQLIELGGRAADGVEVLHLFDKFGAEERFLRFVDEYRRRFDGDPSFSSIIAYEAILVLVEALEKRKDGQSIKEAILTNGPYQGLQQTLAIDAFGDSRRKTHLVTVQGNQFVPAP